MSLRRLAAAVACLTLCGCPGDAISGRRTPPPVTATAPVVEGAVWVLDNGPGPQIVRLDPGTGAVAAVHRVGEGETDMAVSPDGSRLFVSSYVYEPENLGLALSVVEAATGRVLRSIPMPGRLRPPPAPRSSSMAASTDGRWVFVVDAFGPVPGQFRLWTFDVAGERFLPEPAPVDPCAPGAILAPLTGRSALMFCPATGRRAQGPAELALNHEVHVLSMGDAGGTVEAPTIAIPVESEVRIDPEQTIRELWRLSGGDVDSAGREAFMVMENGVVQVVDVAGRSRERQFQVEVAKELFVPPGGAALTSDGQRLLVALAPLQGPDGRGDPDRITGVEVATGRALGTVSLPSFWTLAPAADGTHAYAVHRTTRSVSVIDLTALKVVSTISGVGTEPSYVAS